MWFFKSSLVKRTLRCASYSLVTLFTGVISIFGQASSDPLPNFWRTDGTVFAIAITNNIGYIGGDFTYVGPANGAAGLVDPDFGELIPGFPNLVGIVRAVAGDGAGGWFVGGSFFAADAPALKNLVHVFPDNTLDLAFNPAPDNTVRALLLVSGTLVVGGEFFQIAGSQSSSYMAFLNPATGNPSSLRVKAQGQVNCMALDGDTLYIGGTFSQLVTFTNNNQQVSIPRAHLAAFKPATGEILGWNPGSSGGFEGVKALAVSSTAIYAGGDFTQCGGKPRVALAALNKTDGTASSWSPNPASANGGTPVVNAVAVVGNLVYAGGDFTTIGTRGRVRLAALQAGAFAVAANWQADANDVVQTIVPFGNSLLVGGKFTVIGGSIDLTNPNLPVQTGGTPRRGFAQIDQATAAVADFGPHISSFRPALFGSSANGTTYAIAQQNNEFLVGGDFASIGGVPRGRLAAIDLTTGGATAWNPNADSTVRALAPTPRGIFVGGNFTTIGGQSRPRLALIKSDTGLADTFDGQVVNGQFVQAIAYAGGTLYIGGNFSKAGGADRFSLAELDVNTGSATAWNPQPGGQINAILFNKGQIYVGGSFFGISGASQQTYVALLTQNTDPATQIVKTFNPQPDTQVRALALDQGRLFVAGDFARIAGQDRKSVAALDPVSGQETNPLDVQLIAQGQLQARAIASVGQQLYIGGAFRGAGGENRSRIASVNSTFGVASGWDPGADAPINAIARNDNLILIGGEFTRLGLQGANPNPSLDGQPVPYFAAFNAKPAVHNLRKNTAGHWIFDVADGDGLGSNLQVQTNEKLGSGTWTTLTTLDILGVQDPYEDSTSPATATRFYRLFRAP